MEKYSNKRYGCKKTSLLTYEELRNLGYGEKMNCGGECYYVNDYSNVPGWVYNSNYNYWTSSPTSDNSDSSMLVVKSDGRIMPGGSLQQSNTIRPVLELNKSADISIVN